MRDAVHEDLLKRLIEGRGVSDVRVTQDHEGKFVLNVRYTGSSHWMAVRSRDRNPRTWASMQTLAAYLWRLGVREWSTEIYQEVVTGHDHKLKPKKNRPE